MILINDMLILELLFFKTAVINLYLSGYTINVKWIKLKYFIFVHIFM